MPDETSDRGPRVHGPGGCPAGPAPTCGELTHLTITKVSVGAHDNNAYLLRCREEPASSS